MEVRLKIPDELAEKLARDSRDLSRKALEALAIEGYRQRTLTLYQVSELLGFSRVEAEDFLGKHDVPLASIQESDLDRESRLFKPVSRNHSR